MAFRKEKQITQVVTAEFFIEKDTEKYIEFKGDDNRDYLLRVNRVDGFGVNPRNDSNLFTWVTTAGAGYSDKDKEGKRININSFEDLGGNMVSEEFMEKNVVFPLTLYRHGGNVIYVGEKLGEKNSFDEAGVGFAFADKERVLKEYNWDSFNEERMEKIKNVLRREVSLMNAFIRGDIYDFDYIDLDKEDHAYNINGVVITEEDEKRDMADEGLRNFIEDEEKRKTLLTKMFGADERELKPLECFKVLENVDLSGGNIEKFYGKKDFSDYDDYARTYKKLKIKRDGNEDLYVLERKTIYETGNTDYLGHRLKEWKNEYFYFKEDFSAKSANEFLKQYDRDRQKKMEMESEKKLKTGKGR